MARATGLWNYVLLQAFTKEGLFDHYLLVSMEPVPRVVDGIRILPWSDFLDRLRGGEWL